jgi:hypothetical protein
MTTSTHDQDPHLRDRMRDGRLQQILKHVDGIEDHLNDITELVARLQRDDSDSELSVRDNQAARDRGVTSACWPMPPVQEDSASL